MTEQGTSTKRYEIKSKGSKRASSILKYCVVSIRKHTVMIKPRVIFGVKRLKKIPVLSFVYSPLIRMYFHAGPTIS
jgi:hypothetical protein